MSKSPTDEAQDIHEKWIAAMQRGDFEAAWQQTDRTELRRRQRNDGTRRPGELRWNGSAFAGKRVLIRCLNGLGDTLQFLRFVPMVRRQASQVTLAVQPHLLRLLSKTGCFGDVEDGWTENSFPGHEVELEIMELAYAFRADQCSLPAIVPYLDLSWIRNQSQWKPPAESSPGKLRVGLLWKSSEYDPERSVAPELLGELNSETVSFYTLQQDIAPSELQRVPIQLTSLSGGTREILDAARAMLWLDLIVTVDGMPAHLAGALGRPVWMLLKHQADWRWMADRIDSPWYPSMRLFRQPEKGEWSPVLRRVRAELDALSVEGKLNPT